MGDSRQYHVGTQASMRLRLAIPHEVVYPRIEKCVQSKCRDTPVPQPVRALLQVCGCRRRIEGRTEHVHGFGPHTIRILTKYLSLRTGSSLDGKRRVK